MATVLGPTLMRDRQPMEMKKTIQAYNVFQVAISAYIFVEACLAGWLTDYNWGKASVGNSFICSARQSGGSLCSVPGRRPVNGSQLERHENGRRVVPLLSQ